MLVLTLERAEEEEPEEMVDAVLVAVPDVAMDAVVVVVAVEEAETEQLR